MYRGNAEKIRAEKKKATWLQGKILNIHQQCGKLGGRAREPQTNGRVQKLILEARLVCETRGKASVTNPPSS